MIKNLIIFFVSKLVDNPGVIVVSDLADKNLISIKVSSIDLPKVIGKEGRTLKALRALLRAVDPSVQRDIIVDII